MKERPIIFSAPMVRAILEGRKTQTRRVANVARIDRHPDMPSAVIMTLQNGGQGWLNSQSEHPNHIARLCPYGVPGDRLWVRETHAPQADCWGAWESWMRGDGGPAPIIHYAADFKAFQDGQGFTINKPFIEKWRPSIHMPRWASRILLEITDVRVERLQEISEADARAEGASYHDGRGVGHSGWRHDYGDVHANARSAYARLWKHIHGPGSWDVNPWVWAIEFKRVAP